MAAEPHVLVAGGGMAGLAAAVWLAEAGVRVTLVEQRRHLGGRAHSFADPKSGDATDNGQHLFLSAYEQTLAFLETIGTADQVVFQPRLEVPYWDPQRGETLWLRCPNWPAPLHLLAGALRLKNLSWRDKWALLRAGPALLRLRRATPAALDQITVAQYLGSLGQSPALRRALWDPIVLATLNETPERASAYLLGEVLRRGFLSSHRRSRLGYSSLGLSDLYVHPAVAFLKERGASVETGVRLAALEAEPGRLTAAVLQSGARLEADAYVLALPPAALAKLLAKGPLAHEPFFAPLGQITHSPIVSVNLWFDRPLPLGAPFVGLLDSPIQWVFDRRRMMEGAAAPAGAAAHAGRFAYALVSSAATELIGQPNSRISELAIEALGEAVPQAREARVLHSSVVKEPRATFSSRPGFEALRLPQRTPVANVFLAGDWTQTQLPATLEGACESARRAVEAVEDFFRSKGPALPPGGGGYPSGAGGAR